MRDVASPASGADDELAVSTSSSHCRASLPTTDRGLSSVKCRPCVVANLASSTVLRAPALVNRRNIRNALKTRSQFGCTFLIGSRWASGAGPGRRNPVKTSKLYAGRRRLRYDYAPTDWSLYQRMTERSEGGMP